MTIYTRNGWTIVKVGKVTVSDKSRLNAIYRATNLIFQ